MPVPLRANANLRVEAKYNVVTEFPNYDLHSAAASGNQGLAEYALNRGQPVNSVLDGVLPLHAACAGGHEQVVKLLLDHGADVNAARLPRRYFNEKNRDASAPIVGTTGSTPLHFAAANGNKDIITILLMRGAHADRQDKHGITPAMLAEQHGWLECAEVLNNWVKHKDRDLRERVQPDGAASMAPLVAPVSSGNEDDTKPNTRKHIQVKRSIDTALNMFKAGSISTPPSKLVSISTTSSTNNFRTTSPISPTRSRRDFSPSPSEDGRFSPSPSPIDRDSRRPSLPHVYQTPSSSSQRPQKPATLTKPQNSRRPRSAGTDAEQDPDVDGSSTGFGRGSTGKKLGTKYSLLNLFKKGNESGGATATLSSSPQQNTFPLNDNGPLPATGYRFGAPSHTRTSPSTSSLFHQQTYTPPPRPSIPLVVDLHNAVTSQQHRYPNRDRSGSSGSAARYDPPMGLGISFDEDDAETPSSLSPSLSAGDGPTSANALHAEFPFSLDTPPPTDEVDVVAPVRLQLSPPPLDSRTRGDSVSSTSTADSGLNPSLSASATTSGSGGSGAISTPMISPVGGSYLNLPSAESRPRSSREKVNVPEVSCDDYRQGLDAGPVQDLAAIGINERRGNSALESIDLDVISSHAEAEALVQRTQQDILSAHADGQNSSDDAMPLSARLAALGESLELERKLREQKQTEGVKAQVSATEALEDSTSSATRTEILRQCSLDQLTSTVSSSQQVKRPHANSEGSRLQSRFYSKTSPEPLLTVLL
ncbi:hypothetical protein DFJ43DRAFT_994652 [Lentinula guzmanii]|uniref:Ankyrin n=1 Tax=Lentinula guzmanii TaxID=2804957 RepID=A0AA38JBT1_9AGAR|nr:hypothetical protein DFJ43DRAFT_994652 [Lentinula guzmanii]